MDTNRTRLGLVPLWAALPVSLLSLACGSEPSSTLPAALTVRDSAGIEIVENHRPALDSADVLRVPPEPTLRIGVMSGERAYEFSGVTGLTRMGDGRIVVLDEQTKELRYFSPEGIHLMSVGGGGEGPGEFSSAGGLERLAGDTLQVEDRLTRIRYAPDGTHTGQERVDWAAVKPLGDFFLECSGNLPHFVGPDIIGCTGSRPVVEEDGAWSWRAGHLQAILRIRGDLTGADTVAWIHTWGMAVVWYRSRFASLGPPYIPRGIAAIGGRPRRFVHADTDAYSIEVREMDGSLVRVVRLPTGYRPPRPDELEPPEIRFTSAPPPGIDRRARVNFELDELPPVDSISVLQSLFVDELGRIWGGRRSLGAWDVFDEEGRYLGMVELPSRFTPFEIGQDYVLGVRSDELGVEFVELYDLQGGRS